MMKTPPKTGNRKRADQDVKARDRDLDLVINAIPALVWWASCDGAGELFNRAYLAYSGLPLEQLQGAGWTIAVHPDDLSVLSATLHAILSSGEGGEAEARLRRFDGEYRWFLFRVNPIYDESRSIIRWLGINTEIENREAPEEALALSESDLRSITDTSRQSALFHHLFAKVPEATVLLDTDDRILQVNPEFTIMFGYAQEEACGRAINDLVLPGELSAEGEECTHRGLRGENLNVETVRKHKDGTHIHVSMVSGPVAVAGSQISKYVIYRDITDRKLAEQRLRESQAYLAEGQRLSQTGSFSWSVATGEIAWSEQLYRTFEFDESQPVTLERIFSRVHPDDIPLLQDMIERVRHAASDFEYEHRLLMPDDSIKHIHLFAHATRDKDGRLAYIGAAQDVTRRKMAEDQLRERELNLRRITQTIPGMLWSATPAGAVDYCNRPWHDFTAMTPEQAMGWGWAAAIHPEDRNGLVECWQSCLASGTPFEAEARLRRFDSAYRWFLVRANPLRDESDRIVKWYGANIEIEDRKRREELLRASELSWRQIVDNIPGFVATTGAMGEVEFLNRQTLEYFGRTSEELKDWALIDAVHPDDLPRVIEARKKSIETGQIYDIEHRCRRADGVYRWFQVRGLPVRDTEDKVTAWYLLLTDIDDRKKAEEALQASELDARSSLDNMPSFLVRLSPAGTVEFVNRPFLQYFGKTLEEINQWSTNDMIDPDARAHVIEVFGNSLLTGEPFNMEYRLRRFDGVYRWFQTRANAVRSVDGRILHWNAVATDIDDRKKAEEALQSSERNLSLMINAIPTIIGVMRADGTPLYGNQGVTDYTGLTMEDMLKEDFRARLFHPGDMEKFREARRLAFSRPVPFENEQRALGRDGKYRWFLFRYKPLLDETGKIDRWYMAAFDIDDRKRAEAQVEQAYLRLAEAQRLSKTGSFIMDLLADEHNWSEEAFRIFEFDPSTKVTVQMVRDRIQAEDLPTFDAVIARAMSGTDVDFVFRIVTTRGAVKHIQGLARVMEQSGGRPLFIGALQDVTAGKVAEEALNQARSELAHVARVTTLNTLTASIAHEVNQPLFGIITNASTCLRMLDGNPPNIDGARETARRAIRDGNRASDVISRLRALYSKKEFTEEQVDLNEATREVIALSLGDLQRNQVIVRSEFADELPPVTGDRVQLQQVILNLLRNASDAMSTVNDRPRELLIRTELHEGGEVRLSVKDSGLGFTPEAAAKFFQAFYTTKKDGMGIGLSVSQSIIEAHHGHLWATANDGPGATFSFALLCRPEALADNGTRPDRPEPAASAR